MVAAGIAQALAELKQQQAEAQEELRRQRAEAQEELHRQREDMQHDRELLRQEQEQARLQQEKEKREELQRRQQEEHDRRAAEARQKQQEEKRQRREQIAAMGATIARYKVQQLQYNVANDSSNGCTVLMQALSHVSAVIPHDCFWLKLCTQLQLAPAVLA